MPEAPIGSMIAWGGPIDKIPRGWRVCDGSAVDRTSPEFRALFDAIGGTWGGDGVNLFNLPDLRGVFLRGVSAGTGIDPDAASRGDAAPGAVNRGNHGDAVGSRQGDTFQTHYHKIDLDRDKMCGSNGGHDVDEGDQKYNADPTLGHIRARILEATDGGAGAPRVSSETRPKNVNVYWIIRVQ